MINSSTQILQIKTSGFNLLNIKTINIVIFHQKGTINKENSDIEIDNDVLIVFLTQEESEILKENGTRISISATDYYDVDVSNQIKIIWVKKGSRSNASVGDSFVSQDVFDQTISNMDTKVEDLENSLSIGNGRIYLDYQDGKYGINTDPHRGADTFSPFSSGLGQSSPLILGVIPSELNGTMWFAADDGEERPMEPVEIAVLSSIPAESENGIWCEGGERLAIKMALPTIPSSTIGAVWIE